MLFLNHTNAVSGIKNTNLGLLNFPDKKCLISTFQQKNSRVTQDTESEN